MKITDLTTTPLSATTLIPVSESGQPRSITGQSILDSISSGTQDLRSAVGTVALADLDTLKTIVETSTGLSSHLRKVTSSNHCVGWLLQMSTTGSPTQTLITTMNLQEDGLTDSTRYGTVNIYHRIYIGGAWSDWELVSGSIESAGQTSATQAVADSVTAAEEASDWERIDRMRETETRNGAYLLIEAGADVDGETLSHDTWKFIAMDEWRATQCSYPDKILKIAYLKRASGNLYSSMQGCTALRDAKVFADLQPAGANINNVFQNCSTLKSADLHRWDTSAITNMSCLFQGCTSLESVNLAGWDTSAATNFGTMFYGCKSLTRLDISSFDLSAATSLKLMFYGCTSLRYLTVGAGFFAAAHDSSNVDMSVGLYSCKWLGFNSDNATSNGWIEAFSSIATTVPSGQTRSIALPSNLKAATWAQDALTALANKGYTIT